MVNNQDFPFLIWILSITCLLSGSLEFKPIDNYLIDCGSSTNKSVGVRTFVSDDFYSNLLTTQKSIPVNSISSLKDSVLFETAIVFDGPSHYTFPIQKHGRHLIRLYFFPFLAENFNLSKAKFSVSAQNFTLIKEYRPESSPVVKEFFLNITSDKLVLTFSPHSNSFAYVNALEFFSLPDELIPVEASFVASQGHKQALWKQALETVARVNMGNLTVNRNLDALWRLWIGDGGYLVHHNLGTFLENVTAVNSTSGTTEIFAPSWVYGTATKLYSEDDPGTIANITWNFPVDPGFEYLVRLHFCDILPASVPLLFFNVYVNSLLVSHLNLLNLTSNVLGAPYFLDVIARVKESTLLNVSVGTSSALDPYSNAILNGLEIMKINNSKGSLDVLDSVISRRDALKVSKLKIAVIVGLAVGLFSAVVLASVVFWLWSRRCKRAQIEDDFTGNAHNKESKFPNGAATFSNLKVGYRFPLSVIQESTDNFSEKLVIGVGGFGKVYRGSLRDETKVAVKRGAPQSQQGIAEFRTEIEMLSQFRHRHLVSLIGYCDEKDELIIIYEYMENGTLKNHLYGSDLPSLSWRQRLEICIGSARGLHYLHTGSAKAIIHRDVKSANILLDENFMAKVADFGLSKMGPEIDQTHVSTAVKGSFGYLDPEYLTRQQLTDKSDVYSFGVVMFEILCGRPVIDPSLPREKVNLVEWAMKCQKTGRVTEIIDPCLVGEVKPESLNKYVEIAEKCLAECGIDRPTMGDVLWNMEYALQLQGTPAERSNHKEEEAVLLSHVSQFSSSISTTSSSVRDLAGASLSKVFAQMVVREEMR